MASPHATTSAQPAQRPTERVFGLDLLRASAIALVLVHHLRHLPGTPEWLRWLGLRSYIGVDVFFVLSGWLIGGQLLRGLSQARSEFSIARFYTRRLARTLPPYLAVLAGLLALGRVPLASLPVYALFAQGYLDPQRWLVSWSLCVEEHFYLALPILLLGLGKAPPRHRAGIAAAVACALMTLSWLLRALTFEPTRDYSAFIAAMYVPTHLRLDGLAMGVSLAAIWQGSPRWRGWLDRGPARLAALGLTITLVAAYAPWLTGWTAESSERLRWYTQVPAPFVVSAGVTLILPFAARWRAAPTLLARPVTWLAEHAYALYLVHSFAPEVQRGVTASWPLQWTLALASSLAGAALLRALVEQPALRWRDRLTAPARAQT